MQFALPIDAPGLTVNGQIVAQSSDTYWGNSGPIFSTLAVMLALAKYAQAKITEYIILDGEKR